SWADRVRVARGHAATNRSGYDGPRDQYRDRLDAAEHPVADAQRVARHAQRSGPERFVRLSENAGERETVNSARQFARKEGIDVHGFDTSARGRIADHERRQEAR